MEPSNQQSTSTTPSEGAFLKAMIKVNNPGWTVDQIEQEFVRQMANNKDENYDGGCEACSG